MVVKGVAVAASNYSEIIYKRLLDEYDVVEFDAMQILAQEMATPILLRLGMPIDCLDYTSGEMLFKLQHLEKSHVDDIKSPRDLVKACRIVLEKLSYATIDTLINSIDFGKPRLIMTTIDTLSKLHSNGYLTIESNRTHEVVICTSNDSFLVLGSNPIESVFEIINRNNLLPKS